MAQYRTRVRIGKDRRVVIDLPKDTPEGEAEVTVDLPQEPPRGSAAAVLKVLAEIHERPRTSRPPTREEVEAEFNALRDEWDED